LELRPHSHEGETFRANADAEIRGFVVRTCALGFLAAITLSFRLWFNIGREFPSFPVTGFLLPDLQFNHGVMPSSVVLSVLLVSGLSGLLVQPHSKPLLIAVLSATAMLVMVDVHRLQPWVYQYTLFLMLALQRHWGSPFPFRSALLVVLSGMYFWSGAHKLNPMFVTDTLPYLLQPIVGGAFPREWSHVLGVGVAIIEATLGLGLVFRWPRRLSTAGLIGMHLLVLLLLGPAGHNDNAVIWPWNIALAFILYKAVRSAHFPAGLPVYRMPLITAITLGFAVFLPALSTVGWWPANLSMNVYSGNDTRAVILMGTRESELLPCSLRPLVKSAGEGRKALTVSAWAYHTVNVPAFPETAALIHAGNHFRAAYLKGKWELRIRERQLPFSAARKPTITVRSRFVRPSMNGDKLGRE
jgi:hypothetical protein